jgi:hypothetical protein
MISQAETEKPEGATIVPLIGSSDTSHLMNYTGDKSIWPVYLCLGNLRSETLLKASQRCYVLVALLPVPPKHTTKCKKVRDRQQDYNRELLRRCFEILFRPLEDIQQAGKDIICPDGQFRRCFPMICSWIADYFENVNLHSIQSGFCPVCEAPKASLGERFGRIYSPRDYSSYGRD